MLKCPNKYLMHDYIHTQSGTMVGGHGNFYHLYNIHGGGGGEVGIWSIQHTQVRYLEIFASSVGGRCRQTVTVACL